MIPAHVLIPSLYKLSYLHVMGRLVICGVVHAETVESYFLITFDLGWTLSPPMCMVYICIARYPWNDGDASHANAEDTINKPFAFEISTSTENLFFIAESEKEKEDWINAVGRAIVKHSRRWESDGQGFVRLEVEIVHACRGIRILSALNCQITTPVVHGYYCSYW